jgi:hypothetical protein
VALHVTKRSSFNADAILFKSKHLRVAKKASVCSRDTALRQPAPKRYVPLGRTIRIGHLEVVPHRSMMASNVGYPAVPSAADSFLYLSLPVETQPSAAARSRPFVRVGIRKRAIVAQSPR